MKMAFAKGASELFEEIKRDGFEHDEMTIVSVLRACGNIGDLELGRWLRIMLWSMKRR